MIHLVGPRPTSTPLSTSPALRQALPFAWKRRGGMILKSNMIHLVCPRPTSTPLSTSPAFLHKAAFAMPYFENAGVA